MNYCRALKFEDKPCIKDLRGLFVTLMDEKAYDFDYEYDWIIRKKRKEQEAMLDSKSIQDSKKTRKSSKRRDNGNERDKSKRRK